MSKLKLLIVGGSGFVSGTLARLAVATGWDVWAVTRGKRALVEGVTPLLADRKDPAALKTAVAGAGVSFDLVVDCIAFEPADVTGALEALAGKAKQYVLISTDFVYDPAKRRFPQGESDAAYVHGNSYGGNKRLAELELIGNSRGMAWTIVRPCHIYGPGSLLGCNAPDNRDAKILEKIRGGETLKLVGSAYLQQPIFAPDLAKLLLSVHGNKNAVGQIFNAAGPEFVESHEYYRHIGEALGIEVKWEDVHAPPYLAEHPEKAPFLCHRIYDLSRMKAAGLAAPSTALKDGIAVHVRSFGG
jgi:nucleoside-diphosphate-sugar epimerase